MPKFMFALLALLTAIPATAVELVVNLPGHDDLLLEVPSGWNARIDRPRPELPPTISILPGSGNAFQVLITPLWPMGSAKSPSLGEIRGLVESSAGEAQSQAVERSLPLKELTGSNTNGYYFSATDRQPEPDGYKYLTQGAVMLRELRITFTILVNGEPQKSTDQALEVLRTARRASKQNAT
jgi:hypothetical protein